MWWDTLIFLISCSLRVCRIIQRHFPNRVVPVCGSTTFRMTANHRVIVQLSMADNLDVGTLWVSLQYSQQRPSHTLRICSTKLSDMSYLLNFQPLFGSHDILPVLQTGLHDMPILRDVTVACLRENKLICSFCSYPRRVRSMFLLSTDAVQSYFFWVLTLVLIIHFLSIGIELSQTIFEHWYCFNDTFAENWWQLTGRWI